MKKIIPIFLSFIALFCSGCVFQQEQTKHNTENKMTDILKPLSPKCRKIQLLTTYYLAANESKKEKEFVREAVFLCGAYTFYKMDYMDINRLAEGSEDDCAETMTGVYMNCYNLPTEELNKSKELAYSDVKKYFMDNVEECSLEYKETKKQRDLLKDM